MATEREALIFEYIETNNHELREEIIFQFKPLIDHISRKFCYNKSDLDDVKQVGVIGLLRSLERFDPSKEVVFSAFAAPNIIGEIKHYFRDKNRMVKTPRKLQELNSKIRTISQERQNQGRSPTVADLADLLEETDERILEAMEVGQTSVIVSLDAPSYRNDSGGDGNSASLLDNIGVEGGEDKLLTRETLKQAMTQLPYREREIIYLRFYCGLSQTDISARIGLSQMHVSRILTKSLKILRNTLKEGDAFYE